MESQSTLSLRLSTEELLFLLWLLNTPSLPGMGETPFGNWTEQEIAAALASAERSLRARRFISKNGEGQIQMEQVVMALVGTCAVPEFSVVLTCEAPDTGRLVHYFHATRFMAVEHSNPEAGIHLFESLPGAEAILKRLEELMHLNRQPAPRSAPVKISLELLQRATQAASENAANAVPVLLSGGVGEHEAQELGKTLAKVRRRSAVASVRGFRDSSPSSDGFIILESENGLWAMQVLGEPSPGEAYLVPQSAAEVRQRLKELLAGNKLQFAS